MPTSLKLNAGTLAQDCYPSSAQAFYNEMFALSSALLGDITGIIISDTAPDPEDRDKGWLKLSAASGPPAWPLTIFVWFNGYWIARHPTAPSSDERRLWVGSDVDLITYDGGAAGTVGDASGPMWEIDTALAGRALVAPGTIPGTSPARTLAVGATQDSQADTGEWVHTIARDELPADRLHILANVEEGEPAVEVTAATDVIARRLNVSSDAQSYDLAKAEGYTDPSVGCTEALGSGNSFVQAPPFYGIHVIKRTARIYYVAT